MSSHQAEMNRIIKEAIAADFKKIEEAKALVSPKMESMLEDLIGDFHADIDLAGFTATLNNIKSFDVIEHAIRDTTIDIATAAELKFFLESKKDFITQQKSQLFNGYAPKLTKVIDDHMNEFFSKILQAIDLCLSKEYDLSKMDKVNPHYLVALAKKANKSTAINDAFDNAMENYASLESKVQKKVARDISVDINSAIDKDNFARIKDASDAKAQLTQTIAPILKACASSAGNSYFPNLDSSSSKISEIITVLQAALDSNSPSYVPEAVVDIKACMSNVVIAVNAIVNNNTTKSKVTQSIELNIKSIINDIDDKFEIAAGSINAAIESATSDYFSFIKTEFEKCPSVIPGIKVTTDFDGIKGVLDSIKATNVLADVTSANACLQDSSSAIVNKAAELISATPAAKDPINAMEITFSNLLNDVGRAAFCAPNQYNLIAEQLTLIPCAIPGCESSEQARALGMDNVAELKHAISDFTDLTSNSFTNKGHMLAQKAWIHVHLCGSGNEKMRSHAADNLFFGSNVTDAQYITLVGQLDTHLISLNTTNSNQDSE